MSDFKEDLRNYIDGLEEPVSVHEAMSRGRQERRFRVPVAVLAGAAVVLLPALVLVGLRMLPADEDEVAETTTPPTTVTTTTTTTTEGPGTLPGAMVETPNLVGLSLEDGTLIAEETGFVIEIVGTSVATDRIGIVAQDPQPGDSAEQGSVIRVDIAMKPTCTQGPAPTAPGSGEMLVTVRLQCGPTEFPQITELVQRAVAVSDDELTATLQSLLAGLSDAEAAAGYSTFFSSATSGALESAVLSDGLLTVDFNDAIVVNGAGTSTGSMFFLAELKANLFQFNDVDQIEFRRNGSCSAFWAMFESECQDVNRGTWHDEQAAWQAATAREQDFVNPLGRTFTSAYGEGSRIDELVGASRSPSPFEELGGWLVADDLDRETSAWVLHVSDGPNEMVWLVDSIGQTNEGNMVYRVRASLALPWDEILPTLAADAFLRGADGCSLDGEYLQTLVVLAQIELDGDEPTGEMDELRAWLIDVDRTTFTEIATDGVECEMEVGG